MNENYENRKELNALFTHLFSSTMEIPAVAELADYIFRLERELEAEEFPAWQILAEYYDAADYVIDGLIDNDRTTPLSEWHYGPDSTPEAEQDRRIASWEAIDRKSVV